MKKVLIIEDDNDIAQLIAIHLSDMGFDTERAFNGQEGLVKAQSQEYEIIILDIMLPKMDGIEVCRNIRMGKDNTPILMLTSKSEELDKVLGLEIGADDYVTKPFSIRELIARIKAILRRVETKKEATKQDTTSEIKKENFYINTTKRTVEVYNKRVELSPKEFDLLVLMASHPGKTYTREELLNLVWDYDFDGFEHTVNSHINRLRVKIETNMNKPEFILTTWGVGYRFNDEI